MKKLLLLLAIIPMMVFAQQDTTTIKHAAYTTCYSKTLHYPVEVQWWETKQRVGCKTPLARKNNFQPDPLLASETSLAKDYVGSKTDRGHMCPAADNECSTQKQEDECFYFSNMAPQYHSLNAGDWKTLESRTRTLALKYDSIYVWCGSIGVAKKVKSLSIPTECWKVIYIKSTKTYEAYIFKNTTDKPVGIDKCKVDVATVEKLTNFKFPSK